MRAAIAAKVAEQKAHEAVTKASEASEASATADNPTEPEVDKEIPSTGLMVSLLLGLTITFVMLAGLLSLFACGDRLLQGVDKDLVRGHLSKA